MLDGARVVRANLRAEAVLQRRDDAPAIGVVLRVGAGHHEDIQRQANLVAANLHVALFHDVEQADLDALGEVGQLVEAEDAAIGARHEAVVNGQLVGEVAPLGDLDRVHLAHEVGDGDVRRGELLAVALVTGNPVDRRVVALLGDARLARLAERREGVVVDLAAGDGGRLLVEQVDQAARDARLGLAALAQQDDILPREDGVLDLRQDGLFVADDAGEDLFAVAHLAHQVLAHLLLDGKYLVAALAQLAEGGGFRGLWHANG